MDSASEDRLGTYLSDHLAGAVAGIELCRRAAVNNADNEYGDFLQRLAGEFAADREQLEHVIAALDGRPDLRGQGIAWIGDKAPRLESNEELVGYSPQSRLAELEGLSLGVEARCCLWRTLLRVGDPRLAAADIEELRQRAARQRAELEEYRLRAAGKAFGVRAAAGAGAG